jgi:hypothetical protein
MASHFREVEPRISAEVFMKIKTSGLGLIALGIFLLGAQLVLFLGTKNPSPNTANGENHIQPPHRAMPVPGVLGGIALIAGLTLVAKRPEEADDPRDGLSIPGEPVETPRRKAS